MSETLEIVYIPITEAINLLHAKNPKRHDIGDLCRSIERYGFVDPPKINHGSPNKNGTDGGAFVYGNGRVEAVYRMFKDGDYAVPRGVKQLDNGEWAIPVKTGVDLAPGEADAFLVDHNNLTLSGGDFTAQDLERMWEVDGLHAILDDLSELDALPISLDGDYLDRARANEQAGADTEAQTDKAAKLQESWGTALGQVWQLGPHRIVCGDCTDPAVVEAVMQGERAAFGFTSPPYNAKGEFTGAYKNSPIGRTDRNAHYRHNLDNMGSEEYINFLLNCLNFTNSILKDGGSLCWNVAYNAKSRNEYGKVVFSDKNPLQVQETIVWDKGNGFNISSKNILSRTCEMVFLLSKNDRYFTNQGESEPWFNVWRISNHTASNKKDVHGAGFPVELPSKGIDLFTKSLDIVYDPFSGSGTTIIACHNLGRVARAAEIDPGYVAVTLERFYQHSNVEPKLLTNA